MSDAIKPMYPSPSERLLENAARAIMHASHTEPHFFEVTVRALLKATFEHLTRRLDEHDALALERVMLEVTPFTITPPMQRDAGNPIRCDHDNWADQCLRCNPAVLKSVTGSGDT